MLTCAAGKIGTEILRAKYAKYYYQYEVQDDLILYESSYGRGMTCNPYAIFKAFLQDDLFSQFRHVWVLENLAEQQELIRSWQDYPNVIFVEHESDQYLQYLVSAKYLINNTSFAGYFAKKPGQIYLNTWHSITVKLGFDIDSHGQQYAAQLTGRRYILSANRFTTKIFVSLSLDGLYEGKIIENGYPRNDLLCRHPGGGAGQCAPWGSRWRKTKKLYYAPTWRGDSF